MNIFISILGLGHPQNGYDPCQYYFPGKKEVLSREYKYIQAAELELLQQEQRGSFDKLIFIGTKESMATDRLDIFYNDLITSGYFPDMAEINKQIAAEEIKKVDIATELDQKDQWDFFEKVFEVVPFEATLTVDLTHGFRMQTVLMTILMNYLQSAKNVSLDQAFYGAFVKGENKAPIYNVERFFSVNNWADGVDRLITDANSDKLLQMAQYAKRKDKNHPFRPLAKSDITEPLKKLTDALKNIELEKIYNNANDAIEKIDAEMQQLKPGSAVRTLLEAALNKFNTLIDSNYGGSGYSTGFFLVQLKLIEMLNNHKMYMQSFTAMRELFAALGVVRITQGLNSSDRKKKRKRYGEIFCRMIDNPEEKWNFNNEFLNNDKSDLEKKDDLLPWYLELQQIKLEDSEDIISKLRCLYNKIKKIRNGYDHGWTSNKVPADIAEQANNYHKGLKEAVNLLNKKQLLPGDKSSDA